MKPIPAFALCLLAAALCSPAQAQKKKNTKQGKKAFELKLPVIGAKAPGGVLDPDFQLETALQDDFPALCIADDGTPILAFIRYDGNADQLHAAMIRDGKLVETGPISEAGLVYQPGLATDGNGTTWCVWSQLVNERWVLLARRLEQGKASGAIQTLADAPGSHILPDLKADSRGRVWVTWQHAQASHPDVFTRVYDPAKKAWSEPLQVTRDPKGDWEPRLAFTDRDEALIVFDTYRNGNFDVYLARVSPAGAVTLLPVADSPRYEARAEAAGGPDGTLWVAWEEGPERWGKDLGSEWRKIGGGLHYDRHLFLAAVDPGTGTVERAGNALPLLPDLASPIGRPGSHAIDVPELAVDAEGHPWLFFRYCPERGKGFWRIASTSYDPKAKQWSKARALGNSSYCLDRRSAVARHGDALYAAWPSDKRSNKQQQVSGIYVAKIPTTEKPDPFTIGKLPEPVGQRLQPVNNTPERARDDHHQWTAGGKTYTLYFGDFHRHTDFSNCRTTDDGCILEHYRYAIEATGLDYLGTSDHTEASKVYHPYEWWQTQKMVDLFHDPGMFLGFYAYEREQKWPYGHRNVIFTKRGGPIVYINRKNHEQSIWARPLPEPDGKLKGQIPPWQLWDLLQSYDLNGGQVITMEHTAAGGMGTDWAEYKKIDNRIENLVEIYQGSRESYEGVNAPQPGVVRAPVTDFGNKAAGVYQNALKLGHTLGVFASSDHRSTNISFGGTYVTEFTREGVFEAINARRSIAATDKIFMEFSCNGHLLGERFATTKKPELTIAVHGTAPIKTVTLVRNEKNYQVFTPEASKDFETVHIDDTPLPGENRYYLRIEQIDGNMGWTSPLWVEFGK